MCRLITLLFLFMSLIIAPSCLVAKPIPRHTPNHNVRQLPPPPHSQKHYKPLQRSRVKYGEYCYYAPVPKPHYECESYHIRRDYVPVPLPPLKYKRVRPLPPNPPHR